nr:hypothetical protein [Candidatus Baldrarchaeota archaeon]
MECSPNRAFSQIPLIIVGIGWILLGVGQIKKWKSRAISVITIILILIASIFWLHTHLF